MAELIRPARLFSFGGTVSADNSMVETFPVMRSISHRGRRAFALLGLVLLFTLPAIPYSVLSHEAMIDALWAVQIRAILLAQYPGATPEQLKEAHGYAYGGSIIQDMGFYPHGNGYFSDLTHYIRAGDFIANLLANAHTLDELAFALGALSHYAGDCDGHREGTNVGESRLYPKLAKKYGAAVTYENAPSKHVKTEYGFDVLEVAKARFAPEAYHDFIGFNVATPLLETAFRNTYGFELRSMYGDLPRAINSYRHTVSKIIPLATRIAWAQHQDEIEQSGVPRKRFVFIMARSSYERDWGKQYDRPTSRDQFLALLLKLMPPVGPLKTLHFKPLTPAVEKDFARSFELAMATYRQQITNVAGGSLRLENQNFDTGSVAAPAEYGLQDGAYAYWVEQLAHDHFQGVTPAIRMELLNYFQDLNLPFSTKKRPKEWRRVLVELNGLRVANLQMSN